MRMPMSVAQCNGFEDGLDDKQCDTGLCKEDDRCICTFKHNPYCCDDTIGFGNHAMVMMYIISMNVSVRNSIQSAMMGQRMPIHAWQSAMAWINQPHYSTINVMGSRDKHCICTDEYVSHPLLRL
eukprot:362360_1